LNPTKPAGFTWELRGSLRLPASVYHRTPVTASRVNGEPFDRRTQLGSKCDMSATGSSETR